MNTQTFAQAQTVTDEELMAATGGGILGKVIGGAVRKALPKVTIAGVARAGATGILMEGADLIGPKWRQNEILATRND